VRLGQHVGALGHEVHAAEHDVIRFGARGRLLREPERIAAEVSVTDDLVALVVVAEDHELLPEDALRALDTRGQLLLALRAVERWQRLLARCVGGDHVILARPGTIMGRQGHVEAPRLLLELRTAQRRTRPRCHSVRHLALLSVKVPTTLTMAQHARAGRFAVFA
jgi:hypothetical protein